jgi:DNA-binding transcriptional regulator PaaX
VLKNNQMAKTSKDARKHIEALSKLFYDFDAVANVAVEEFLHKHKKRKYLKQSLRRLVKKGFIADTGREHELTLKGIRFFKKFSKNKDKSALFGVWDGKWRLVTFDVPCKHNRKREKIRSLLKEFDFYQLQKSVWICPASLSEKFWGMMVNEELDGYCKVMVVDVLEGDEDLKNHFRIA